VVRVAWAGLIKVGKAPRVGSGEANGSRASAMVVPQAVVVFQPCWGGKGQQGGGGGRGGYLTILE
jgi:hypothetical protein